MIDLLELEEQLAKLPDAIRKAQLEAIQAKEVVERAKLLLNVATSKATLEAKGSSAQDRKAESIIKTVCEQEELLTAQIEYERKDAEYNYVTNRFVSLRKVASLEQEAMRSNISGN